MEPLDLTQGAIGPYTPQRVLAKFVRSMVIAPPNVHFLDPEILELVDTADPDQLLIIPLRCRDRRGALVGSVNYDVDGGIV